MQHSFLTPDQLFEFFIQEECPYWVLYNARRTREVISRYKEKDQGEITKDELLTSSWEQLYSYLFRHPGGLGKLVLKASPNANNDKSPTLYVKWGTAMAHQGAAAGAMIGSSSSVQSGGMDPMTERLFQQQEKFYEQRMQDQKEMMELLFRSREQEATIEGLMEPSLQENLIREGVGVLKTFITAQAARPQAQLGTLGEGSTPAAAPPPMKEGSAPLHPFDGDQAARDIATIQEAMPDIPANQVLHALANWAKQNPDMARNYITMLMQSS